MRRRYWLWIGIGVLAILVVIGIAIGQRDQNRLGAWCRDDVHIGEAFGAVSLPSDPVSVSQGTWTYTGGISVTFLDGQVYDKSCG